MPDVVTAVDLWDRLVGDEMIRPADYDTDLVEELRRRLNLPGADFGQALSDARLPAEDLIRPLLGMIEPVSAMMGDLLVLYQLISARRTRADNVRFSFNFDADAPPLDIDLEAFREFERVFRRAMRPTTFVRWDQSPAWRTVEVLDGLTHGDVAREDRSRTMWPDPDKPFPRSGISTVDEVLAPIWELRRAFLSEAMLLWPNRADYSQGFDDNRSDPTADHLAEVWGDESNHVRGQLAVMVSDFWDLAVGEVISAVAERARSDPAAAQSIAEAGGQLNDLVASLTTVQREVEHQVEDLLELLSLPVWGKRHEVYSAWVFTQIVSAIGFDRLAFHVHEGRLSFDFSGAHLASVDTVDGPVRVWAELRTRYDTPVGKGRSGAIQPDYSLSYDPVHEPATTLLAVECKQYKQSVLRTHADALTDYTGGLPNALVVLAAYGPVSARVLDRLPPAARGRAAVISGLRPGNHTQLRDFHDVVARVIPRPAPPAAGRPRHQGTPGQTTDVTLEWQAPVDLDLHAELVGDSRVVCFSTQRVAVADGFVQLDRDARVGPATETITIATGQPIRIWIHAYDEDASLVTAGARISIATGSTEIVIPVAESDGAGTHRWFDVCLVEDHRVQLAGKWARDGPAPSRAD